MFVGEHARAGQLLDEYQSRANTDLRHLAECAQLMTQCQKIPTGVEIYRELAKSGDRDARYNLAANLVAVGEIAEAESVLQNLLEQFPTDGQAQQVLSGLEKATREKNSVDRVLAMLSRSSLPVSERIQLHFALGKELEDLGEYDQAFSSFQQGARIRRRGMQYRVEDDVRALALIGDQHGKAFNAEFESDIETGLDGSRMVFVCGLPRSGTTLVDRILSSHSDCGSLGEITDFPMSLMVTAGKKLTKETLIQETAQWSPKAIAAGYLKRINNYPGNSLKLIDKTPLNFLYAGLIARSMPSSTTIWMERHPMDSCFGMFKTLFQMGYPFSYDLKELGFYYVAYWNLKERWRTSLANSVTFQRYEDLVHHFDRDARALVERIGLDWEESCGDFHKNKSAVATASSAQVRSPLYKTAVERWRHYESQLAPLAEQLERAGIPLD